MGPGPYLVVPFFGPATVRDAAGFAIDRGLISPITHIDDDLTQAGLLTLNYIDFKSDILSTTNLIGEASLDKYDFIKNAYFEKRNSQINGDGFIEELPAE